MPSLISISASPMIPSPICRQSLTVLRCSASGCRSSPSSSTLFSALTAMFTVLLKSCQSNLPLSTNAARLIAPSRHEPPAGSGSSAPHTMCIKYISHRALDCRIRFYQRPSRSVVHAAITLAPCRAVLPVQVNQRGFYIRTFIWLTDLHQHIQNPYHYLLDSSW